MTRFILNSPAVMIGGFLSYAIILAACAGAWMVTP